MTGNNIDESIDNNKRAYQENINVNEKKMTRINVRGDGNCFYYAVIMGILLTLPSLNTVPENIKIFLKNIDVRDFISNVGEDNNRVMIACPSGIRNYIKNNVNKIESQIITKDEIKNKPDNEYANENDINALGLLLKIQFIVYNEQYVMKENILENIENPIMTIYLYNTGKNNDSHFQLLVPDNILDEAFRKCPQTQSGGAETLLETFKDLETKHNKENKPLENDFESMKPLQENIDKTLETFKNGQSRFFAIEKMIKIYNDTIGNNLKICKDDVCNEKENDNDNKNDTLFILLNQSKENAKNTEEKSKLALENSMEIMKQSMDTMKKNLNAITKYYESNISSLDISNSMVKDEDDDVDDNVDANDTDADANKNTNYQEISKNSSANLKKSNKFITSYSRKVKEFNNSLQDDTSPFNKEINNINIINDNVSEEQLKQDYESIITNNTYKTLFPNECEQLKKIYENKESNKESITEEKSNDEGEGIEMTSVNENQPSADLSNKIQEMNKIIIEINNTINERGKIENNFKDNVLSKIGNIQGNFKGESEKVSKSLEELQNTFENFRQKYIASLDSFIQKDIKQYSELEKYLETVNTNMSASVAETVKYDEIKIMVETGSYTVEQSRHLNQMESLFTKHDEEEFKLRAEEEAKSKITQEELEKTKEEIKEELSENKDALRKKIEKQYKKEIETSMKRDPVLASVDNRLEKIEDLLKKDLEANN